MPNFETVLKEIIADYFLLQGKDTPYLNEQTVQFKFAVELYKRLGIEVELEKCFNPNEDKRDYLDIFYREKKIGIELKYKLKSFEGYPFKNQAAQDLGTYGFFIDIHRLEKWVYEGKLDEGYGIIITNDKSYTKNKRGNVKDFSLTEDNQISAGYGYITHKGLTTTPYKFRQNYPPFQWQCSIESFPDKCNFYACVVKVSKPDL